MPGMLGGLDGNLGYQWPRVSLLYRGNLWENLTSLDLEGLVHRGNLWEGYARIAWYAVEIRGKVWQA